MHPGISVTSYTISLFIVMALINICLRPVLRSDQVLFRIKVIYIPFYFIMGGLPIAGALLPDSEAKFIFQALGNIWLGFYVYMSGIMLLLLLLWTICDVIRRRVRGTAEDHMRRLPGRGAILAVSVVAGVVLQLYGMKHAQDIIVTSYDVNIDKDAGDLKEMKIVLIADLHMSVNSHHETIQKMVDLVNQEDADAVVIAGDIFTSSYGGMKDPDRYAEILRGIKTRDGVYAVYGNHDVEETLFGGFPTTPIEKAFRTEEMEQFFKDAGFTVLYDEIVMLEDEVQLAGRVDGEKAGDGTDDRLSAKELLAGADKTKPVIVLEHEPVEFANLKENGADLALCGHTHAGQIFPGNLVVPFFNENAYGYKVVSGLQTIVTSGVGYYGPPMRVGTTAEITVVNLTFGDET